MMEDTSYEGQFAGFSEDSLELQAYLKEEKWSKGSWEPSGARVKGGAAPVLHASALLTPHKEVLPYFFTCVRISSSS